MAFGITLGGHGLLVLTTLILLVSGYDIFPVDFLSFPLSLNEDVSTLRDLAWTLRDNDTNIIRRRFEDLAPKDWPRAEVGDKLDIYYEIPGGNIFTKENLQMMKSIEDEVFHVEEYQKRFCQVKEVNGTCEPPLSILRLFDGTFRDINPKLYDPDFNDVPGIMYAADTDATVSKYSMYFHSRDCVVTENATRGHLTRSAFFFGEPLEGVTDRTKEWEMMQQFQVKHIKPVLQRMVDEKTEGKKLVISYISVALFTAEVQPQAMLDMALAIGSICFIFLFIWFQTGSLWITGWSVLSIVTCFVGTNLIYRVILDYRYFGYLHIISIFIILGIGADDIFVFCNTWKATAFEEYRSLAHRLSDCFRRSMKTMFITSLTTSVAFFATGFSPLLGIGSFGVFSGILVVVNYISVVLFVPTVVITHHYFWEEKEVYTCLRRCRPSPDAEEKSGKNFVVVFFRDTYYRFITYKYVPYVVIVCFLGFIAGMSYSASTLKADAEEVEIYRPTTNYGRAWARPSRFKPNELEGDQFVQVNLVWGMHMRDLKPCHFTDRDCTGQHYWDEGFEMNLPNVQLSMKDLCNRLKYNMSLSEIKELRMRQDSVTGMPQVSCFTEPMEEHLKIVGQVLELNGTDFTYPIVPNSMEKFVNSQPFVYNMSAPLPKTFHRHFEIGLGHWLTTAYTRIPTRDTLTYNELIGEARDFPYTRAVLPPFTGLYGNKLMYVAILVNTTLPTAALSYTEGLPVMDSWEQFFTSQLKSMPVQLRYGFQTSSAWPFLKVQESLVSNAITGIILGISLALPILVIATANFIIGLVATLIISAITASVIGVIPWAGWKLGVMVSMNLSLIVGLSVDYVVHMAEGYHISAHKDRKGRVRDMLEHVGISIVSGACTTLGAAFFMFFAHMQFFLQFATMLFCTIGFSMVFTFGLFTALMVVVGPQGDTGSLMPLVYALSNCITGRSKSDVKCRSCRGKGFVPGPEEKAELEDVKMNGIVVNGDAASVTGSKVCLVEQIQYATKL